jgi:ATP-dependent DNA helicase MPH1
LLSPGKQPARHKPTLTKERSLYDLTFDIDDEELQRLDEFIEDTYQGKAQPVAGPSRRTAIATHQTTLFGDVLPSESNSAKPRSQIKRTKSTPRNPFGQQAPKTKQWDQTAFAKTGLQRGKSKGKGKARLDDDDEEELVEFEQFPAPFVSSAYPFPYFYGIILNCSLNQSGKQYPIHDESSIIAHGILEPQIIQSGMYLGCIARAAIYDASSLLP